VGADVAGHLRGRRHGGNHHLGNADRKSPHGCGGHCRPRATTQAENPVEGALTV
jgi:hypothetical protein